MMQLQKNLAALPELCYAKTPTDEVVVLKRGEGGCYPLDYEVGPSIADELIKRQNERLGVTPQQREAMLFGSMFGFDKPGANPEVYAGRAK